METSELVRELEGLSSVQLGLMLCYINSGDPELVTRALAYVRGRS